MNFVRDLLASLLTVLPVSSVIFRLVRLMIFVPVFPVSLLIILPVDSVSPVSLAMRRSFELYIGRPS